MISRFFIERPVLSNVIAILTIVLGLVSLWNLPVAQYPEITPPTVQVTTSFPGASARVVAETVGLPIEQQVNGVEDMIYMQSTSASDGTYNLTVTFKIGTDLNFAQVLVQNRVSAALASLPQAVQTQGVTVQKRSTSILMFVTLSSPDNSRDSLFLANYGTISLRDELSRLPGVGNVSVFGAGNYSMRIWLDPKALQARSLTPQDVINALKGQSQDVTAGQVGMPPSTDGQNFQYTIDISGRLNEVSQYEDVVVKTGSGEGGQFTRIRDIGRVELGARSYSQVFMQDGKPAAALGIFQLPGANALQVRTEVAAKMEQLAKNFPPGVVYSIPFDTTMFVNASINEVYRTLIEAALLVLVVIVIFLQDWRAMLVPATTVPVTIIGAFAAMAALGFTVNLSTLFGIVLAIGIVVDDAIVVVEGATHHIEQGMSSHDAAIKAMDDLFGPIVGITLVLMAVFIPASFLPGLTGKMYAQFALVIAATAFISAINAATLKPTQCALWLRPAVPPEQRNFIFRAFNAIYARAEAGYLRIVRFMVRHAALFSAIGILIAGAAGYGVSRIPTGFLPIEDQGYFLVVVQLPDGASLERTNKTLARVADIARKTPGVQSTLTIAGVSALDGNASLANAGAIYLILKNWDERGKDEQLLPLYMKLSQAFDEVLDAKVTVVPPPAIQGIGNAAGFTMQVELRDGSFDFQKLQSITDQIVSIASTQTGLQRAQTTFRADAPQYIVEVDRIKAQTLFVPVDDVFRAVSSYLGSTYVAQFNKFGRTFQVYAQADSNYRQQVDDINHYNVRNEKGEMVPLGTLVQITPSVGPSLISLYNLYPSASVIGMPATGFSSGQAMGLMEQIAERTLPTGSGYEWTAMSYQEKQVGGQLYLVFGLAMLLVYLVLAGQYESWYSPIVIVLSVPLALVGPVLALMGLGVDNNLYVQIGLVLLIALSAKNAILIVEVARELRVRDGKPLLEAAVDASRARFRAILMTSFAFIISMIPLVLATGAGANARKSIGLAVFSGMLASTCLAVLFVPTLFVVVQRCEEWIKARGSRKKEAAGAAG